MKRVNPPVEEAGTLTAVHTAPAPIPRPQTPTAEDFRGFGPPSDAKRALMRRSIPQLEAELERVTLLSSLPRTSIDLSLAEYRTAIEATPRDVDPTNYRKELLSELIIRWRAVQAVDPPPDRRIDELEAVFLTMRSSFDVHTRRRMLTELKKAMADEPDPDTAVKRQLMEWIATFGEDTEEDELEIIDE